MSRPLNPWNMPEFKAGQNITCRVEKQEREGYAVTISKDNLPGFLPTDEPLKIGQEVLAQFVCISNNRILLTTRFSSINTERKPIPYVQWDKQLDQEGSEAELANSSDTSSSLTEEEAAFKIWAEQVKPKKVPLRRATDLLLPPLNQADTQNFTMSDHGLEWLITDLEGGMRSGCLKASSQSRLSRSAMLLYRGRCVGCIYSNKQMPESPAQEDALRCMLSDLHQLDTQVTLYDLPENFVLASSALFLGYPVERQEDGESRAYLDYTLKWLAGKKYTACLTISLTKRLGHCFVYIYRGQYVGAFYVEDQIIDKDKNRVYAFFDEDPQAVVNVQILPPEMTSSAIRFGFSLSVSRPKMDNV